LLKHPKVKSVHLFLIHLLSTADHLTSINEIVSIISSWPGINSIWRRHLHR